MKKRLFAWRGLIMLAVAIVAFLVLTIPRLNASTLWFDESFTAYLMRFSPADIVRYTASDVHPPLYYLLLRGWSVIFGASAVALRSFSIVWGVIALIVVYRLVQILLQDKKLAGAAAIAVAVSPLFIRYGIEARMYMMTVASGLVGALTYLRAEQSGEWRWWLSYGVIMALGMWTHYFMAIWWLGIWAYRLVALRRQGRRGRELARSFFSGPFALAHVIGVGLYLPWIPVINQQRGQLAGGYWIPAVTLASLPDLLAEVLLYRPKTFAGPWSWSTVETAIILFVAIFVVARDCWRVWRNARGTRLADGLTFFGVMTLAPIVVLLLVSLYPDCSFFISRYLLSSITLLYAVLGIMVAIAPPFANWLVIAAVLACFILGDIRVWQLGNYNFNTSAASHYTMTGEVVQLTDKRYPILASGDYNYYEAAAYETAGRAVYYDYNLVKDSSVGSLAMLKENKLGRGITDMTQFGQEHQLVWVVGSDDKGDTAPIAAPSSAKNWRVVKTIGVSDPATGRKIYRATLYETQ